MSRYFNAASAQYAYNLTTPITAVPMTFACWFHEVDDSWNAVIGIGTDGSNNHRWTLNVTDSGDGRNITAQARTTANSVATGPGSYSTGAWQHAGAVFAAANSRTAYLNGVPGTPNTQARTPSGVDAIYIGNNMGLGSASCGNRVARAGVWSVALNDQEFAMLAAGALPYLIQPANLVGYWELLGHHSPEPDWSGNGWNLTVSGAVQAQHVSRRLFPTWQFLIPPAGGTDVTVTATPAIAGAAQGVEASVSATSTASVAAAPGIAGAAQGTEASVATEQNVTITAEPAGAGAAAGTEAAVSTEQNVTSTATPGIAGAALGVEASVSATSTASVTAEPGLAGAAAGAEASVTVTASVSLTAEPGLAGAAEGRVADVSTGDNAAVTAEPGLAGAATGAEVGVSAQQTATSLATPGLAGAAAGIVANVTTEANTTVSAAPATAGAVSGTAAAITVTANPTISAAPGLAGAAEGLVATAVAGSGAVTVTAEPGLVGPVLGLVAYRIQPDAILDATYRPTDLEIPMRPGIWSMDRILFEDGSLVAYEDGTPVAYETASQGVALELPYRTTELEIEEP